MNKKTLKQKVENVMREFPATRNCDIKLTKKLWRMYFADSIVFLRSEWYVRFDDLEKMPRESAIVRIRAMIQNKDKKYVPTDKDVAFLRGFEEEEWRRLLGYAVSDDIAQGQWTFNE